MNHLARDILQCHRVAVYGTLKKGRRNHGWLEGAPLLGSDRLTAITLYDLGLYPGAKAIGSEGALVEIYTINAEQLALLDQLEDYSSAAPSAGLYRRVVFTTRHGNAWCYLYNLDVDESRRVEDGEW